MIGKPLILACLFFAGSQRKVPLDTSASLYITKNLITSPYYHSITSHGQKLSNFCSKQEDTQSFAVSKGEIP